ncbi:hypothetical protein [Nocardia xishanensis]
MSHPAAAVAVDALAGSDRNLVPVAVTERGDVGAVVVEGEKGRFTVIMEHHGTGFVAPGMIVGSYRSDQPRANRTPDQHPLQALSRKQFPVGTETDEPGWVAVTGTAALDAVSIQVISSLEETTEPIGETGLAVAVVRARTDELPRVVVHTADGRAVPAFMGQ